MGSSPQQKSKTQLHLMHKIKFPDLRISCFGVWKSHSIFLTLFTMTYWEPGHLSLSSQLKNKFPTISHLFNIFHQFFFLLVYIVEFQNTNGRSNYYFLRWTIIIWALTSNPIRLIMFCGNTYKQNNLRLASLQ